MNKYYDIINLPHHVSNTRKPMTLHNRAAQFAPFAALKGYDSAIKEEARITSKKIELDEELKTIINENIKLINNNIKEKPKVMITYFIPDNKKTGGSYETIICNVKKIDNVNKFIVLTDNKKIDFDNLLNIVFE